MNMIKKIVIFSLLCFLMGGCIGEDMDDCGRFRLQFRHTYNNSGQDLLAEQVGCIRVYVFDRSTGTLTDIVQPDREDIERGYMDIEIENGVYTFVSWGCGGDDFARGGYAIDAAIGSAAPDDFRLMLTCDPAAGGKGETSVVPHTQLFDHLFFAIAEDIEAMKGRDQTVELDFIMNTSTLKVIVNGLEHLTRSAGDLPLDIFSTGSNYLYRSDNALDNTAAKMLYQPYDGSADGGSQTIFIRQQRLSIVESVADPVMLYIRHAAEGYDMIMPLELVEAIRQNPAYRSQEAIDREDLFVIELSILLDLSVRVTVNDWEIIILDPNLYER